MEKRAKAIFLIFIMVLSGTMVLSTLMDARQVDGGSDCTISSNCNPHVDPLPPPNDGCDPNDSTCLTP